MPRNPDPDSSSSGSSSWTTPPVYSQPSYSRSQTIISLLRRYMEIASAQAEEDRGTIVGRILDPLTESIAAIREYLKSRGYMVLFRKNPGNPASPHVVQFAATAPVAATRGKPTVNIILFVLTVFTTLLIGSLQQNGNVFFLRDLGSDPSVQANYWNVLARSLTGRNPLNLGDLLLGVPFSFALLLILGSHELGHYLTARRYGVDATLPYFLPIPHPLMGTMGAFIRIKSPIPNRQALIRLGVAGPLTGFVFAVPTVIVGLMLSKPVLLQEAQGSLPLGSSLLFGWLSQLRFPHLPAGYDVSLHPLAFAGWLGFFVTALNLIPVGQLDGGHIAYVALGRYRRLFQYLVLMAMVGLGFLWSGWFFWGILVLILGLGHPPTQDEITPMRASDKLLMLAAVIIFALTFIPAPFPKAGL